MDRARDVSARGMGTVCEVTAMRVDVDAREGEKEVAEVGLAKGLSILLALLAGVLDRSSSVRREVDDEGTGGGVEVGIIMCAGLIVEAEVAGGGVAETLLLLLLALLKRACRPAVRPLRARDG